MRPPPGERGGGSHTESQSAQLPGLTLLSLKCSLLLRRAMILFPAIEHLAEFLDFVGRDVSF
ncbi:hypothetical protein Mal52_34040 [Symmachiella dynata]|uniref:Uncharacterized protein n=1 Tax=Symmachiella dynata TaxID=2527995 RepID=A0A517ZR58_9PLAN|nr:hypothetical protein Mal52_34040 [Symmachiella dynata]